MKFYAIIVLVLLSQSAFSATWGLTCSYYFANSIWRPVVSTYPLDIPPNGSSCLKHFVLLVLVRLKKALQDKIHEQAILKSLDAKIEGCL